jgi:UDP-glucose 4-epimerase
MTCENMLGSYHDEEGTSMKVLVTGSAGFIGSALMDALVERGHAVRGMDKTRGMSTALPGMVRSVVRGLEPDMVVHAGASCSGQLSLREPEVDFVDNVVGTFNLLEALREWSPPTPVIFMSTMKIEKGEDGNVTPYGVGKAIGETYVELYHKLYGVPYIVNRPSSVYGPGQGGTEDGGWVTHFIRQAIRGEPIRLWVPETNSRDVLYIDDMVSLLVDQVENFELYANRDYTFGGGPDNELSIATLLKWLDAREFVEHVPAIPGDIARVVNQNVEINAVNGWYPRKPWPWGVSATYEWIRKQEMGVVS